MTKKKLVLLVAAVALMGAVAVGGTLAWFTSTETATNVVTMGNVAITLTETKVENEKITTDADGKITYTNVMPGDTFTKDPTVALSGTSANAYVVMYVKYAEAFKEIFVIDEVDASKWFDAGLVGTGDYAGYTQYIYNGALTQGESATLFTKISVGSDVTSELLAGAIASNSDSNSFGIDITAFGIQADNVKTNTTSDMLSYIEGLPGYGANAAEAPVA